MESKSREEVTENMMSVGYILDINTYMWTGMISVRPVDLGLGCVPVPLPRQRLQVVSKAWLRKVQLLRASVKRSLGMTMSHAVRFDAGIKRYVFEDAAALVADSIDASSLHMSKYYKEMADNYPETTRVARQVITKNADHLWRTVSHLFPQYRDKMKAPEDWKIKMVEAVMANRFPTPERLRNMKLTYSIYRTQDSINKVAGRRQIPFPGLVKDNKYMMRSLRNLPGEMIQRLSKRTNVLRKEYKCPGIYGVTLEHLERDLLRLVAYTPVEVPGYEVRPKVAELREEVEKLDKWKFRRDLEYRASLANKILELKIFIDGEWKVKRMEMYEDLYGGYERGKTTYREDDCE